MKTTHLILLSLLCFACEPKIDFSPNEEKEAMHAYSARTALNNDNNQPYALYTHIEKLSDKEFDLIIDVELKDGAYFVSPNSKGDYKGKFSINILESNFVKVHPEIMETPIPIETINDYSLKPVSWIKENTTFRKRFTITQNFDLFVRGTVQFVIEPQCVMTAKEFIIKFENGNFSVREYLGGC